MIPGLSDYDFRLLSEDKLPEFHILFRNWEIPVEVQTFDQVVDGKLKDRKTVVYIGNKNILGFIKVSEIL